MKYKPTKRGIVAVIFITCLLLLAGWFEAQPAEAMVSLEQQRIDRERAADRRHAIEIEKIRAAAYIEAAKYQSRQCRPTIIYRRN